MKLPILCQFYPQSLIMPLIVFVPFVCVFIAPATRAADKTRISVSGGYNMIFLSAGVAQHRGLFRDEGLDADIVVMGAAPSIAALTNGDIDFTLLTGSVIRAAIRGLPVRLVAGLMTSSPHVLLARPEIKSVKDLSGKKVGLASFGDATQVLARIILARNGVDPDKEVQFVPLGPDSGRFAGPAAKTRRRGGYLAAVGLRGKKGRVQCFGASLRILELSAVRRRREREIDPAKPRSG